MPGNPGLLWVDTGSSLWSAQPAANTSSCEDCHGAIASMRGVATRYPAFNKATQALQNLTQRIERCRTENQHQPPAAYESETLLSLTAVIAQQSKGLPYAVEIAGAAASAFAQGRQYFYTRRGQFCNQAIRGPVKSADNG